MTPTEAEGLLETSNMTIVANYEEFPFFLTQSLASVK